MKHRGQNDLKDLRLSQSLKPAFTVIELLVVILILGVLLVLLIPAVQMARESARRTQCLSNLRQLGIAMHGYVSATGVFPPGYSWNGFSLHTAILPYLEGTEIYSSINIKMGAEALGVNMTVLHATPNVFMCPTDSSPRHIVEGLGFTNYAGNRGVGVQKYGYNGLLLFQGNVDPASVTDGLSHTAAMSEWLTGNCDLSLQRRDARRSVFRTPERLIAPSEFDQFSTACHAIDTSTALVNSPCRGFNWMFGEFNWTLYNHTLSINDHSCTNGTRYQEGAWTVTSLHPGGADVVFADAHAKFVKETISLSVWRGMGSRNGGEANLSLEQ